MAKVGIVVLADVEMQGDKGRAFNALTTARELKEAGDEVTLLFEGAGTKWVRELARDDGRFGEAFAQVADVAAACSHCAGVFGVTEAVEAAGLPLLDEYASHPSLKRLVDRGYQVITF
jgi:hypothetical protein